MSRCSEASTCPRTRSIASASKRGLVSASRSKSKASSRYSFSDAQRAVEIIAADLKAQFDGVVFETLMEDLGVEIAGALIEQIRGEIGGAGLVRLVLAGAAMGTHS